jgi:hypothetical protein
MANSKISALSASTTPLAGTEVLPIVQSGSTVKVAVSDLTAGRAVSAASLALTTSPLPATSGGTGQSSYAVGDLLYASTTTALSKLADVATGNAVISGGVGVAPSYGKIGLTTHVSGTLPVANGGTNLTSFTANGIVYASSTSALATGSNVYYDGTSFGVVGRLYNGSASTFGASSWAMSLGNGGISANYFKGDNTYWQNASGTQTLSLGSTGVLQLGSGNLQLYGDSNPAAGIAMISTSTAPNIRMSHATGTASGAAYMEFNYNQSGCGSITQNGASAVLYNITSDYRLKANQQPLTGSGAFIDALKPKSWTWITDGRKDAGFIAHEFQEVCPNAVIGVKDETIEQEYEVSPAVAATETQEAIPAVMGTRTVPKYQAMQASSSEVIANLVAEIQSLRSRLKNANIP